MSNYPIITVYIINHNYGQYIEEAIHSVINQKYKKIDIIIVDDKSSDNSAKIISEYERKKNIRIIYNSKKLGLIKSSNIAIRASTGEFVLRLDADDILHKNCIFEQPRRPIYMAVFYRKGASKINLKLLSFLIHYYFIRVAHRVAFYVLKAGNQA